MKVAHFPTSLPGMMPVSPSILVFFLLCPHPSPGQLVGSRGVVSLPDNFEYRDEDTRASSEAVAAFAVQYQPRVDQEVSFNKLDIGRTSIQDQQVAFLSSGPRPATLGGNNDNFFHRESRAVRPPPENAGRIDNEHPCALHRSSCDVPEQLLALALMKKIHSQENSDGLVNMLEGFEPRSNVNELASNALGSAGPTSSRLTLGSSGGSGQGAFTSFGSSGKSSASSSSQGTGQLGPFTNLGGSQQGEAVRQGTFATVTNLGLSQQSPPRATAGAQSSFTNFANPGSTHQQSILGSSPARQQTFSTFANLGANKPSPIGGTQSSFTNFANPGSTHQQSILGSLPSRQTFENPGFRQEESILNSSPTLQAFASLGSVGPEVDIQSSSSTFRNPGHSSSQTGRSSLTSFTNLGSGQESALGPSRHSTFSTFHNIGANPQGSVAPLKPVLGSEVSSQSSFTTFSDPVQKGNSGPLLSNEFSSSSLGPSRLLEQGSSSGGGFTPLGSLLQNTALSGSGDTFGQKQASKAFVNFG